jgi:Tfp pilus assembly protein PilN
MPGWGIVANLIPPELLQARRVRALQKLVGFMLVLLLLVAGVGGGYAMLRSRHAAQQLSVEQNRTSQLLAEQGRYRSITEIQGNVAQVRTQLAKLMGMDVDTSALLASLVMQLPAGGTVSQLALSIAEPTPTAPNNIGASVLDTSGQLHIGTITISGQVQKVADVATYVNRLSALPGLVDPYPATSTVNDTGAQFTVQLSINDSLLSQRYALSSGSSTGGN